MSQHAQATSNSSMCVTWAFQDLTTHARMRWYQWSRAAVAYAEAVESLWSKKFMAGGSAQCRPISLATVAGCI